MPIRNLVFSLVVCLAFVIGESVQADVINFGLEGRAGIGLLPGNETGDSNSNGSGDVLSGILFDTDTNMLTIDVGWGSGNGFTDLTGDATAMHIHGPADFFNNAGVLYPLSNLPGWDPSASSGGFNGTLLIDAADVPDLLDGLLYLNVHTDANPPGEIRGNMVRLPIPEPSSMGFVGVLTLTTFFRRKR